MKFAVDAAPHVSPGTRVSAVMNQVLIALAPGVAAHVFFFGWGVVVQIMLAVTFALAVEAAALKLRGRPLRPFLTDGTAPVTAVLYVLCLPPLMPWWTTLVGMVCAIGLAKHAYGGLGHNAFNPAMVGYAVVLVSFPVHASHWIPPAGVGVVQPGPVDALLAVMLGDPPGGWTWDAVSRATPLDTINAQLAGGDMLSEIRQLPIFGDFGGRGWEWIANAYILGGLWLLYRRVISWQVPVAILATVLLVTLPFYLANPDVHPLPLQHIFSGGLVLGAFFIATDPVSGAATPRGRLIFGCGVALLVLAIRRWGSYADGVAFAVLLMNLTVPLLDRYARPRVYGHR